MAARPESPRDAVPDPQLLRRRKNAQVVIVGGDGVSYGAPPPPRSTYRFYSMSAQIRRERGRYYTTLERTQKGTLDVTPWQEWFLSCLLRAIEGSQDTLRAVLTKVRFWESFAQQSLNVRQVRVLNRLLDGVEGRLTT